MIPHLFISYYISLFCTHYFLGLRPKIFKYQAQFICMAWNLGTQFYGLSYHKISMYTAFVRPED
jgi:hypothetical protein